MSTHTDTDDTTDAPTRATHHADSSEAAVKRAKDQLAWLLERRDCREWAISSQALADATGRTGIKATTVRDCIKELRRERGLPIVACSQGYYLISDAEALERELDRIAAEIQTREETRQELCEAFNQRRYGDE